MPRIYLLWLQFMVSDKTEGQLYCEENSANVDQFPFNMLFFNATDGKWQFCFM